ncbi:mitochondrial ribosomal protein S31 isoform X2 [Andrena cerasifolii]|uniref:mitochondrial ribosomal protein S31 isoform X2 n=1 Tax=Andrena cerasifolii TaxID=2819439 RepID=UPI00403813B8
MLPKCLFSKNIRTQIALPCQWLSMTINTVRSSSNSSSSDSSSGSDSDNDVKRKILKEPTKPASGSSTAKNDNNDKFSELINNLLSTTSSKTANVRVNVRDRNKKIEKQLSKAADTLTTVVGGDKEKILSTLLESLSNIEKEKPFIKLSDTIESYRQSIETRYGLKETKNYKNMSGKREKPTKFDSQSRTKDTRRFDSNYKTDRFENRESRENRENRENKENVNVRNETRDIEKTYKSTQTQQRSDSVIYALLNKHKDEEKSKRYEKTEVESYATIFTQTNPPLPDVPEFKVWNICEQSELKIQQSHYPETGFQEMIQWTEEGKLWKFPIDNEQGMEEEQNVHFSEHVFLERHLTGWCPTIGPIRHYMELVCVGLSKNPYMTVQEKYDHIMWYKNYFDDNQDLLKRLGLIDAPASDVQKQIDAP